MLSCPQVEDGNTISGKQGEEEEGDGEREEVGARAARRPCEECQACGCPPYCTPTRSYLLNALYTWTQERVFCGPNRTGHMFHRLMFQPQPFGFSWIFMGQCLVILGCLGAQESH